MIRRRMPGSAAGAIVLGLAGLTCADSTGPNIATCDIFGSIAYGSEGQIHAFGFGIFTVNSGDALLHMQIDTDQHPVVTQNLYRYRDGRLEMIGMSWVLHLWCALNEWGCGPCRAPPSGCAPFLAPDCRKAITPAALGFEDVVGMRSEVNASTSTFVMPWTNVELDNVTSQRLQVHEQDLDPALNVGAIYYAEVHHIHPQEGTSDRRHDNASYRQYDLIAEDGGYQFVRGSATVQHLPAIYAWKENDPLVVVEVIDVPGEPIDGRFHLAYRVFENGDGTWRYDYALHNMNSDRAARGFSIPVPQGVSVLSACYHDVKHHSGEPYTDEDWIMTIPEIEGGELTWMGMSFTENENANVLRWGTMFNFGFVADAPPTTGDAAMTFFKPGTPEVILISALVPDSPGTGCVGDLTGSGDVGVFDLLILLGDWGACRGCPGDLNGDGHVDVFDLLVLLGAWGPCE